MTSSMEPKMNHDMANLCLETLERAAMVMGVSLGTLGKAMNEVHRARKTAPCDDEDKELSTLLAKVDAEPETPPSEKKPVSDIRSKAQKARIEKAKAAGEHYGRHFKVPKEKHSEVFRRYELGESQGELADSYGVSRNTIWRIVKRLSRSATSTVAPPKKTSEAVESKSSSAAPTATTVPTATASARDPKAMYTCRVFLSMHRVEGVSVSPTKLSHECRKLCEEQKVARDWRPYNALVGEGCFLYPFHILEEALGNLAVDHLYHRLKLSKAEVIKRIGDAF